MFRCSNPKCETEKHRIPTERPVKRVIAVRRVKYVIDGHTVGYGEEIVKEVDLCKVCDEIADTIGVQPNLISQTRMPRRLQVKSKKQRRREAAA